jgi:hypothetical protein
MKKVMSKPAPSPAERCVSGLERAIREKETHSWCGHKACDLLWTEANEAVREIAALRAALKKAEEENELLKWEIQNCRKALDATIVLHSAAKARLSEIVKSLAAAVTKEKP